MSTFKEEITGAQCVVDNMAVYAEDSVRTKLPNTLDGLKPIHRRILVCIHEWKGVDKEVCLVGDVTKMHPHGDAAIAESISTMAQPFSHICPLVYSASNIGKYVGDRPAASRYVDVGKSDMAEDLFFGDTNPRMLKMIPRETGQGLEPANLIPVLPTALLVPIFGIAVGYQTHTVACGFADLCKLTKEYIKLRGSTMDWESKLKPLTKYLLPEFATECRLRSPDALLKAYRAGDFEARMLVDGSMHMTADSIVFRTLPPTESFKNNTTATGSQALVKTSWIAQNFSQVEDFSGDGQGNTRGDFNCILRRGINPFDVLARLKKELQFSVNWHPSRIYVDSDGVMSKETPFSLLDKWYQTRHAAVLGGLKETLKRLIDKQRMLRALIVVVDHTDEVYKIFKTAKSEEETVVPLATRFKLTKFQAHFLSKLTMSQITARGRDDLLKDLEKVNVDMKELQLEFTKIDDLMIKAIEKFEDKYLRKPYEQGALTFELGVRNCTVPKYIGTACYKRNGWIMLESEAEMDQVLKDFPDPESITFDLFESRPGHTLIVSNADDEKIGELPPKYLKAGYVADTCYPDGHAAVVCEKGGALVADGFTPKGDQFEQLEMVGDKFITVSKSGQVDLVNVSSRVTRKSAGAGPTLKDVIAISPLQDKEVIVIHGNSSQPNLLNIDLVKVGEKLRKVVVGQWKILKIVPLSSTKVVVNIPKELRSRCVTRFIQFERLGELMTAQKAKGVNRLVALYGRANASEKNNFDLVQARRKSDILLAKYRG